MPAKARVKTKTRHRKVNGGVAGVGQRRAAARASGLRVKVGLPVGSAAYPDGTDVIKVGAVHEFGSEDESIPERSWLRSTMSEHAEEHAELARNLARAVDRGDRDPREALELLGTRAAANAREMIVEISSPPLAAETIRRKGSANPLVNDGHLKDQVTHQVVED